MIGKPSREFASYSLVLFFRRRDKGHYQKNTSGASVDELPLRLHPFFVDSKCRKVRAHLVGPLPDTAVRGICSADSGKGVSLSDWRS